MLHSAIAFWLGLIVAYFPFYYLGRRIERRIWSRRMRACKPASEPSFELRELAECRYKLGEIMHVGFDSTPARIGDAALAGNLMRVLDVVEQVARKCGYI
jgi:hypothetical protein